MAGKKLPKALQKKKKAKLNRVKGSSRRKSGKHASRAMRRQLQKQGIQDMQQIDATEVIIRCPDKDIVIEDPQVMQLKQQGMTVHQVIGEPTEREPSDFYEEEELDEIDEELEEEISAEAPLIKDQDVMLVAGQANVSEEVARNALEASDGDLAKAILKLKTQD